MSDSSDEEDWAAFASVAVSGQQVLQQQEIAADRVRMAASAPHGPAVMILIPQAKKQSSRAKGQLKVSRPAADQDTSPAGTIDSSGGLDLFQLKIGALLDKRLAPLLSEAPSLARGGEQAGLDPGPACAAAEHDNELGGLRFFKRVPPGMPAVLTPGRAERTVTKQPGTSARDRILGSTRYAVDEVEVGRCFQILCTEAEQLVAAEAEAAAKRQRDKLAARQAESDRRKRERASLDALPAEGLLLASPKKKKKKKKLKLEATVTDMPPFVPHSQRMKALLGLNGPILKN